MLNNRCKRQALEKSERREILLIGGADFLNFF